MKDGPSPRRKCVRSAATAQGPSDLDSFSSRNSQVFASRQSRVRVSGEIFKTVAVSSTLSPPKNRNSTTRLRRGSSVANALSVVERHEILSTIVCSESLVVQRDLLTASSAFLITAGRCIVHQDAPHQASRYREKVRAIAPAHPTDIDQSQIRLVDECGDLQDVAGAFVRHVPTGDTAELLMQPIEGGVVPRSSPPDEQLRDVMGCRRRHSTFLGRAAHRGPFYDHKPFSWSGFPPLTVLDAVSRLQT